MSENTQDEIQPREVTDENPIVEGETPEGLTASPIEGEPQPTATEVVEELTATDVGSPDGAELADGFVDRGGYTPSVEVIDEVQDFRAEVPTPDEITPTEEELTQEASPHEDVEDEVEVETYPPHELDLPASHAPFDPSHGAR